MKREFLTQFMERLIVELEREQRDGTAHVYQSTLKRLKKFANGREVSFKVGSINSIFYFLHKAAEPFNCLEQDNLA